MPRPQKPIEQQLAEAQAQRQKLDARLKDLEGRKKAEDIRLRAKGEKVLLRVLLDCLAQQPELKNEFIRSIQAASLNAPDRETVLWILSLPNPGSHNNRVARKHFEQGHS